MSFCTFLRLPSIQALCKGVSPFSFLWNAIKQVLIHMETNENVCGLYNSKMNSSSLSIKFLSCLANYVYINAYYCIHQPNLLSTFQNTQYFYRGSDMNLVTLVEALVRLARPVPLVATISAVCSSSVTSETCTFISMQL